MNEVKHVETPTTIKFLKWLLILIVAGLGIRLAIDLWNLPGVSSLNLTSIEYAKIAFDTILDIAFIIFLIFILKWIKQRNKWGRWGALVIVLFYMGRVRYPTPVMPSNATEELLTRYNTDLAISLTVWLVLLFFALNLIFRKAVKAYFLSSSISSES
jgi:uncharacterized protein YacL